MEHLLKRCSSNLWRWRFCITNKQRAFCTVNTPSSSSPSDPANTNSETGDFEQRETVNSTTATGGDGERRETVIDRLRRLSMTPADEYELSPIAQEKAREMAKVRKDAMKRGEQWKWDQRNLRPGGPPPPPRQYGGYDRRDNNFGGYGGRRNRYDEEEDEYETEGRYSRQNRFNDDRRQGGWRQQESSFDSPRRGDTFDDVENNYQPENYELEMQKLREKMQQTKIKKEAVAKKLQSEDDGSERNVDRISSSSYHERHEHSESMASSVSNNDKLASASKEHDNSFELGSHHEGRQEANAPRAEYSPDHAVSFTLAEKNPDTFGNLSFATSSLVRDTVGEALRNELLEEEKKLSLVHEEEEEDDTRFIPTYGERWTTPKLINKVRQLLEEKKLKEAVDTFLGVLKQGGFHFEKYPIRHHFHVLINSCADAGYVEMAFRLFNLMKKRGYKEKMRTISSLLNACANSPWDKENNLDRIDKLLLNMQDRQREMNLINYHALIKAYGRLGETVRAFHVVDKMMAESNIEPNTETFNMLLQACITDKKNGFRYALVTWRKMQSMESIRPDIFSYNLLLRAVAECEIELAESDLMGITDEQKTPQIGSSYPMLPVIVTEEDSNRVLSVLISDNSTPKQDQLVLENLGEPITLDVKALMHALRYRNNRMALLGGVRGIMSQMARDRLAPNLKTLTELLAVSRAPEITDVLQLLSTYKIKPNVVFFTQAIKQCYYLNEHQKAEEMLKLMNNVYHITPNIVTWGVLTSGCRSWMEAKTLLAEMDKANIIPNLPLLGTLMTSAMKNNDPRFVLHVIEEIKRREVTIDDKNLLRIDDFIKTVQKGVVAHELGKKVESKPLADALEQNPEFGEHFALLKMRYKTWLNEVDVKIDPENPWKADFDHFKTHKKHKTFEADDRQYESLINASAEN